MSFDEVLKKIVEPCSGSLGAALMGVDGIPIAQVRGPAAGVDAEEEVAVLSVELGRILAGLESAEGGSTARLPVIALVQVRNGPEKVKPIVIRYADV